MEFLNIGAGGTIGIGFGQPGGGRPSEDLQTPDTSETIQVSSLALLKMLKHGRAGVPMEVMGLMLGQFIDDYTITVIDVFAMPQTGTGVSVEAVDPVFQAKMLDMLRQTGRPEMVVGWYHSHPGFGCWLSMLDVQTQKSFEALNDRAVALVIDPIQSVKGKVVMDAFRTISIQTLAMAMEARQTTSVLGHLTRPTMQAILHGLNRQYYSLAVKYNINELEQKMLLNLHKQTWMDALSVEAFRKHNSNNQTALVQLLKTSKAYAKVLEDEDKLSAEQRLVKHVGKQDPKRHLEDQVNNLLGDNIVQSLVSCIDRMALK